MNGFFFLNLLSLFMNTIGRDFFEIRPVLELYCCYIKKISKPIMLFYFEYGISASATRNRMQPSLCRLHLEQCKLMYFFISSNSALEKNSISTIIAIDCFSSIFCDCLTSRYNYIIFGDLFFQFSHLKYKYRHLIKLALA